ncbi:MAG: nucleotidyltransferase family protein [Nitrospirae bacterium]|nr:nucleotidyltransferase family protein [Nitrospirota bacterium]
MRAIEILKAHGNTVMERYHVKRIGVFGSFARGEEREGSDVDVLIELEEEYETFDNYMDLKFYLQDLFGRKVDLVTVDALRPQLRDDILREVKYA